MTLPDTLRQSAEELLRHMEEHRNLLARVTDGQQTEMDIPACFLRDCPHRQRLKEILAETIEILEQSRKAFKSRQLADLRKKLIRVLSEEA